MRAGRVPTEIRVDPGPSYWPGGYFRPRGRVMVHGPRRALNPVEWSSKVTWSARLFVGLSVGNRKAWTVAQVVALVRRLWRRGASFVSQRGLWKSPKSGRLVPETSVQVILLDLHGDPLPVFRAEVIRLAEALCSRLRQEQVVVEFQRNGLVKETLGVIP